MPEDKLFTKVLRNMLGRRGIGIAVGYLVCTPGIMVEEAVTEPGLFLSMGIMEL